MLQVRKDPLKAAEYFRRATEAAPNFAPALEAYGHFLHKCSPLALSPTPPYPVLPCPARFTSDLRSALPSCPPSSRPAASHRFLASLCGVSFSPQLTN